MIRSFLAIEVPSSTKEEINKMITEFKKADYPVRWVEKENLHLTLIFFGEVKEDFLQKAKIQIISVTKTLRPFEVNLSGLGAFPSQRSPRVIWLSVKDGKDKVADLQTMIEKSLITIGYKPEARQFHPHLTLGRVKGIIKEPTKIFAQNYQSPNFLVKALVLFKSTLRPEGPLYEKLHQFDFG